MIVYFSGTGNSLSIAKDLAKETNESIMHINDALKSDEMILDEKIGIIFPVYCFDLPNPIKYFIEQVKFNPSAYIYGIATCGGTADTIGNSLYNLNELLIKKNLKLSYAKVLTMPDNSYAIFSSKHSLSSLDNIKKSITQIASDVTQNIINTSSLKYSLKGTLSNLASDNFVVKSILRKSVIKDRCNNCSICERICPANNIENKNGKINIGNHCTLCLACVHWCPNAAIKITIRKISKSNQYHHPDVTLKEMLRK